MAGSFGSGGSHHGRKWRDNEFLENHPRIRVGGLRGHSQVTLSYGGKTQIVPIEEEWTFGRQQRLRRWFRCPCGKRCRFLVEKEGAFVCRLCSGYDYRSRHRNQSCPSLNKVRKVAGLPARALARERIIAQVEIARLLRVTVRDLRRRAKRGKR
jgi:hypothetical protein